MEEVKNSDVSEDNAPQAQARARFPAGFWAIVAIVAWALAVTALINRAPYGLDEATARAVLFLWSIADQVASPIVTLGVPDFRTAFLAPAGVLFSGSLLAVKLLALLYMIALTIGLFRWHGRDGDTETPLLASGLLLLSPLAIAAVDTIAVAPFLLLAFLVGAWAADGYRESRARFGGFYFIQVLACFAAITLHPAGVALPIALALPWLRVPAAPAEARTLVPGSERSHVLAGLATGTVLGLLVAGGWPHQAWLANPLVQLTGGIFAFRSESNFGDIMLWLIGALVACAALATLWWQRRRLLADAFGLPLALAVLVSSFCGDAAFALLTQVLLLYWGFPLLLQVRLGSAGGFWGQRGVAFALLVVASTLFLSAGRARLDEVRAGLELTAQDRLIQSLAQSVQSAEAAQPAPEAAAPQAGASADATVPKPRLIRVASQWPGRTMVACRCSALPLPPATDDQALFRSNLRGIDFVLFDPQRPANRALARNFALMGGAGAETVSLQSGGVVLRMHLASPPLDPGVQG